MKFSPRLVFLLVALAMSMIFISVSNASAQMDSYQDLLARSSIAISNDGKVALCVQKEINYLIAGEVPGEVRLPIVFANLSGENDIKISEFVMRLEGHDYQDKKVTEIKLPGVANPDDANKLDITWGKNSNDYSRLKNLAKMSVESLRLPEDIEKGKPQTLLISAVVSKADGSISIIEAKSRLTFRSLPTRIGWYCGDGHMHTTWSDGLDRLDERVAYLKNAGLGWGVLTDHEKLLRGHFAAYSKAIASCSEAFGLPLAPGMEIIAAGNRGHALAYGLNEHINSQMLPNDTQYTCQGLIDHINNIAPKQSFTVLAHPYSSTMWQDIKNNGNFKAMELASGGAINEQAFSEWMGKLRSGEKITALGSSDCHLGYPDGMTYLYIPDYSSVSFDPVWQAIKMGRATVSEKGHLGIFAINGQTIGSTLKVPSGAMLTFTLIQQACSGVTCIKIEVLNENGQAIYQSANPPANTTFKKPANARFYLLRAYFSDGSKVISNPIYVEQG